MLEAGLSTPGKATAVLPEASAFTEHGQPWLQGVHPLPKPHLCHFPTKKRSEAACFLFSVSFHTSQTGEHNIFYLDVLEGMAFEITVSFKCATKQQSTHPLSRVLFRRGGVIVLKLPILV